MPSCFPKDRTDFLYLEALYFLCVSSGERLCLRLLILFNWNPLHFNFVVAYGPFQNLLTMFDHLITGWKIYIGLPVSRLFLPSICFAHFSQINSFANITCVVSLPCSLFPLGSSPNSSTGPWRPSISGSHPTSQFNLISYHPQQEPSATSFLVPPPPPHTPLIFTLLSRPSLIKWLIVSQVPVSL